MKLFLFNGITLQVLYEVGYEWNRLYNDFICFDLDNKHIVLYRKGVDINSIRKLSEIKEDFEDRKDKTWRSDTIKEKWLKYHNKVIPIMESFRRDFKINEVLDKNENSLILAC